MGSTDISEEAVVDLGTAWLDESTQLLIGAFEGDPTVRYVCSAESTAFERHRCLLYKSLVRLQVESGEPRLGIISDQRLVAVCHLLRPGSTVPLRLQWKHAVRVLRGLGPGALIRGARFILAEAKCRPADPHWYLVSIAVDPMCQGHGYAGRLLQEICEGSETDPACHGVALDTQNRRNVSLYERFGYRVTHEQDVGPLRSWCMFRPNHRWASSSGNAGI
jgi:ribosomal protein S18 acetylase RimI-like enzyme